MAGDRKAKQEVAEIAALARTHGVARLGVVSAHRTRAGRVIWKINGNLVARKDAQSRIRSDGWLEEAR